MAKTRLLFSTFFVIAATVAVVGYVSGAWTKNTPEKTKITVSKIRIITNGSIAQCRERGLENKILFLMSRYCPNCKKVKPVIEKLVRDEELELYYQSLDLSFGSERNQLNGYNIEVQFVPTLIVNCYAYVGAKKREQYSDILKAYKLGL